MRDRLDLAWIVAPLALAVGLASCDRFPTPPETGVVPEGPAASEDTVAVGAAMLQGDAAPLLPDGIEDLPIAGLLRMVLVPFPEPEAVGVCHTQVASRARPVPFRVHRLEVEIPEEAWDEAEGETAYLQYRRFGQNGFVLRVARCVIPASMIAVNHLFDRFSLHRSAEAAAGRDEARGPAFTAGEGWTLVPRTESPPRALSWLGMSATASFEEDDCVEDSSPENPCEVDEFVVDGSECTNPYHDRNEDGVCECSNGSTEEDCFLEDEESPSDPDDDPICEFEPCGESNPDDSDDSEICDPSAEICEDDEDDEELLESGWDATHEQGEEIEDSNFVCPPKLTVSSNDPLRLRHYQRYSSGLREWWFWTWGTMFHVEGAGGGGFGIPPRAWYSIPQGPWSAIAGISYSGATLYSGQVKVACRMIQEPDGRYTGYWWTTGTREMDITIHP